MPANNTVIFIGRVGSDVSSDFRTTGNGTSFCKVSLAVDSLKRDDRGEKTTFWYTIEYWGKKAELMRDMVSKGDLISISGSMSQKQYTPKDGGQARMFHFVSGSDFQILQSKNKGQRQSSGQPSYAQNKPSTASSYKSNATQPLKKENDYEDEFYLDDDELPPF